MSENRSVQVLGGARSGKSTFALEMVKPFPAKTLIATLEPKDEEMKARIARHKRERGPGWSVIEEPVALARAVTQAQAKSQAVIVDCMTLWLTNVLLSGKPEKLGDLKVGQWIKAYWIPDPNNPKQQKIVKIEPGSSLKIF